MPDRACRRVAARGLDTLRYFFFLPAAAFADPAFRHVYFGL
jgi:hypothetical protein